ncbi:MAG: O-phospho-L-seryl-tRNA:Cys-tRNA synthase [Candidatus Lokiarchaeota archaeon]
MRDLDYNQELINKYSNLRRNVNEKYINIHPIQRGGILTPEAYKALINYGDGYSLCDNCLKGRIDKIQNPPVVEFLEDMASFLHIDNVIPTAAARESKRLIMNILSTKFPKRKVVIVDSLAHYTTYLAVENNGLRIKEVPNSGDSKFLINPEDYERVINEVIKEEGELPLLILLTHVDYKYGNVNDPNPIGEICKKYEIPFVLNAAYSAGILNLSYKKDLIDFITCSGHKSMAASGPIGLLGFSDMFYNDIMAQSQIQGDITSKSYPNKVCILMGCPPVYGAPLITLIASFPDIVRRTQKKRVEEELKKVNYVVDKIKKINGIRVLGKVPKLHPLVNLRTLGFEKVAKTHTRRGFFLREEFKERGIIGMLPGISTELKFNTFGLSWNQIKRFTNALLDICSKYGIE